MFAASLVPALRYFPIEIACLLFVLLFSVSVVLVALVCCLVSILAPEVVGWRVPTVVGLFIGPLAVALVRVSV